MNTEIIDELIIRVCRAESNLLQVRWINNQGGHSYWTFYFNNFTTLENKDVQGYSKYITDISTVYSNLVIIGSSQLESITAGAGELTINQYRELNKITFCEVLVGSNWVTVSVEHKSTDLPARSGYYEKEIKFIFGNRLNQQF